MPVVIAKQQLRTRRFYFGMTPQEIGTAFILALVGAVVVENFFSTHSLWAFFGIAFSFFIIAQIYFTSQRFIVLPEFISIIACVSWVIAPWLSYFYPSDLRDYEMVIPMSRYLSYTLPCVIALWLGLHIPLKYRGESASVRAVPIFSKNARFLIDVMIFSGTFIAVYLQFLPRGLQFLFYVIAQLRFVGLFLFMLSGTKRWALRAAFVYISLFTFSSTTGVFYEFIIWCGYLLILIAYARRWRLRLIVSLILMVWMVTTLNTVKFEYRRIINQKSLNEAQKVVLFTQIVFGYFTGDDKWYFKAALGDRLVRWNQGWIIARVMATVPRIQDYAKGETIIEAIKTSMLPRLFFPNKTVAVSRDIFVKYTNYEIPGGTSMALGTAGELYANFGKFGILAMGLYGWFVGFMFSRFARLSKANTLWWAWVPFVMFATVVCEWNLSDILNYLTKSLFVMLCFLWFLPVFKRELFPRLRK